MRALVTGATGFVGRRLLERLDHPVVLTRNVERTREALSGRGVTVFGWDPQRAAPPAEAFDGIDAVFHLAGEPIAEGRWTEAKRQRLRDSRVLGTRHLVEALGGLDTRPRALVSASAIGYYGDRGDEKLEESAPPADDFLGQLCVDWEQESRAAEAMGVRVANPRIGIVLGAGGGALAKMLTPFKLGLGGRLASGRQWMSWVHRDDLVEMLLFAAEQESLRGAFNAVAPQPATNLEFTKTLGKVLGRPTLFPAPAALLKLAIGEFADVLLASQRVLPKLLESAGFAYRYADLEAALREATGRG